MKLYAVYTSNFKLDGGAMFGVVPKALWNKSNPADENNMIELWARCLLIVDGDKKILVDFGLGDKQDDKFRERFKVNNKSADEALGQYGFKPVDITDVILTHLHFDHCGGATKWNADKTGYELTFRNADYWLSKGQYEAAIHPNKREVASILPENIEPVIKSKRLKLIEKEHEIIPNVQIRLFNGHTVGQAIPLINYNDKTVVFTGDFLALSAHIPIPFVMSYDIDPLLSMEEKEKFMKEALENNYILFFEHDPYIECCTLKMGKKGTEIDKTFLVSSI